jgi:hypothetical protein
MRIATGSTPSAAAAITAFERGSPARRAIANARLAASAERTALAAKIAVSGAVPARRATKPRTSAYPGP